MFYQNAHSVKNKLLDIKTNIQIMLPKPDIIVISETWLHDGFFDSELGLTGYNIHRQDRNSLNNPSSNGGGVMICSKKHLSAVPIQIVNCEVEMCCVRMNCRENAILVIPDYIPTQSEELNGNALLAKYESAVKVIEELKHTYPEDKLLIIGDFNLSRINWSNGELLGFLTIEPVRQIIRSAATCIRNSFASLDLKQHYPVHSQKGYTLDLLFSDTVIETIKSLDSLVKCDTHHESAFFSFDMGLQQYVDYERVVYNFNRANFSGISESLNQVDWDNELDHANIDTCVSNFYDMLNVAIEENVPKMKLTANHFPPWYTAELKQLIFDKKKFHAKSKDILNSNRQADHVMFKKLRAICISVSRTCYRDYTKKMEAKIRRDSKKFWSYVNNSKKPSDLPNEMYIKEKKGNNHIDIANLFADRFSEVFSPVNNQLPLGMQNMLHAETFCSFTIDQEDILRHINKLENTHSAGPDEIPSTLVKKCATSLVTPLLTIFNMSLEQGQFPSEWKRAFITPIHQDGDKHNVCNYRPISLLNVFAKLFESLIKEKILESMATHFSVNQHAYIKGRSTVTNLLLFSNFVSSSLDIDMQVDAIYLDFAKAFDKVDHLLLIAKLRKLGFGGNVLKLLRSYLYNRTQVVNIKGYKSKQVTASSGMPQGSILGPILFAFFINDLFHVTRFCKMLGFADDCKLFHVIGNIEDAMNLQLDLHAVFEWSVRNRLPLNINKCKVMSFSRHAGFFDAAYEISDEGLLRVSTIKDLGVIFDNKLSFAEHQSYVINKARRKLGFIKRSTRDFVQPATVVSLFKSMVVPTLTYASQIWSPHSQQDHYLLEQIVHLALRYAALKSGNPMAWIDHDYTPLYEQFNMMTIKQLHARNDLCLMYKVLNGMCNNFLVSQLFTRRVIHYGTRRPRLLKEKRYASSYGWNSPVARLTKSWNLLATSYGTSIPLKEFKELVSDYVSGL